MGERGSFWLDWEIRAFLSDHIDLIEGQYLIVKLGRVLIRHDLSTLTKPSFLVELLGGRGIKGCSNW